MLKIMAEQVLGLEEVAKVDDKAPAHSLAYFTPGNGAKHAPLCEHYRCVGFGKRVLDSIGDGQAWKKSPHLLPGCGIIPANLRALGNKLRHNCKRGSVAHVVGIRFEGEP